MASTEHKPLDHRGFSWSVIAAAVLVTATAPLMVAAVVRAPGIAAMAHAGAICSSAALMLWMRSSAWAKWGRVAWAVSGLHCLIVTAGALTDVPAWIGATARVAAVASIVAICFTLAEEARAARGAKAARAWKAAAFTACGAWLTFLAVQGVWNDSMEAAVRRVGGLVLLACAASLFGPAAMVYRAASESRLPLLFRGWCTFCGYDMRTLSTRTCPECGKTSHLRREEPTEPVEQCRGWWKPLLLHCLLGLLGGAAVGGLLPNNELHRVKPLWLLMRECRLGPDAFSSHGVENGRGGFPPMWEIFRRADDGELDQVAARRLVEHALSVQADAAAPPYQWLELFMLLDAHGFVTDAQRRAFEERLATYTLKLPASVPEGGHLPFTVVVVSREPFPIQSSVAIRDWTVLAPKLTAVFVDGVQVPAPARVADAISQGATATHDFTAMAELPRMPLGPGKRRVKMEFEIKSWANDRVKQVSTPTLTRTVALEGDVILTPGAPPTVARITDPAAFKPLLDKWTWTYESYRLGGYKGRDGVAVQVLSDDPSLAFSVTADVVIEYKGKEYPLGRLVLKAGDRSAFIQNRTGLSWEPDFAGDVLPLVIRATNIEFESGLSSAWAGPEQRVNAKFRDPPPKRD